MTYLKLAALAALAFSLGACTSEALLCAPGPCNNGLYVQLATAPAGPFRVEVMSAGLSTPRVYECTATSCASGANFPDFQPSSAVVTVTYEGRTTTANIAPKYDSQFPNGTCGPGCSSATVTVPLP